MASSVFCVPGFGRVTSAFMVVFLFRSVFAQDKYWCVSWLYLVVVSSFVFSLYNVTVGGGVG